MFNHSLKVNMYPFPKSTNNQAIQPKFFYIGNICFKHTLPTNLAASSQYRIIGNLNSLHLHIDCNIIEKTRYLNSGFTLIIFIPEAVALLKNRCLVYHNSGLYYYWFNSEYEALQTRQFKENELKASHNKNLAN